MPRAATAAKNVPAPVVTEQAAAPTIDAMLLADIYDATRQPPGFTHVVREEAGPLSAAGLVEVNVNEVNGEGKIGARITQTGVQWLRDNAPDLIEDAKEEDNTMNAETAQGAAAPTAQVAAATAEAKPREKPILSSIVANVDLSQYVTPKRGGARPETYPFSQLQVGQSFFVQATAEIPDPVKALASTVASATARYAEELPGQTRKNRKGVEVPATKPTRVFRLVRVEDGKAYGEQFAGKKGAAVERTQ